MLYKELPTNDCIRQEVYKRVDLCLCHEMTCRAFKYRRIGTSSGLTCCMLSEGQD